MKIKNNEIKLHNPFPKIGKAILSATEKKPFICCLAVSFVMNLLIYMLHARSPIRGFAMIFSEPGYFLFNTCILIAFYSLSLIFAKRLFAMALITIFWAALGITNGVLMGLRVTPLEAIDFYILRTGLAIVNVYLNPLEIVLISLAILAAIALLVLLFIKSPKIRPNYTHSLRVIICCLLVILLLTFAVVGLADADPQNYDNIKDAYDVYGFPYCFLRSIFDRGIKEPENYSEEQLQEILAELAKQESAPPDSTPNVIFVQLESFFDISRMKDLTLSENPIPNFTALREEGLHGLLSVPTIGSGTVNTEFEILSGLDMEFFGTGEYPYESILGELCCETVAYDLSELGYTTHGMHNHTATFYDRFRVYANLGFDTFTAAENMIGLEYNDLGWEKDKILTKYILKALESTETPDFVFAVSVQGHGKYPEFPVSDDPPAVTLSGIETEERRNAFEYYANQLREMDAFIGELVAALEACGEDTVLVLYGDHLPALDITKEELTNQDLFTTDYVVWSNFDLPRGEKNLEAYQLFSEILGMLDINNGLINKIHREYADDADYSNILELVGYDMLYGDRLAYGDEYPYTARNMTIGLDSLEITGTAFVSDSDFFVEGTGFTAFSHVFVNGHRHKTTYLSENSLYFEDYTPEEGDIITVVQISVDLQKLSSSPPYIVSSVDFEENTSPVS